MNDRELNKLSAIVSGIVANPAYPQATLGIALNSKLLLPPSPELHQAIKGLERCLAKHKADLTSVAKELLASDQESEIIAGRHLDWKLKNKET